MLDLSLEFISSDIAQYHKTNHTDYFKSCQVFEISINNINLFRRSMTKETKFIRTYTYEDDEYERARINRNTGEITLFSSNKKHINFHITSKPNAESIDPFWLSYVSMAKPESEQIQNAETLGKSRKKMENPHTEALSEYLSLSEALEDIPELNYLIDTVQSCTDGERPPSRAVLFNMLRDLKIISSDTVSAYAKKEKRQSERLSLYTRVLAKALSAHQNCLLAA
jgi:hypothetical protein